MTSYGVTNCTKVALELLNYKIPGTECMTINTSSRNVARHSICLSNSYIIDYAPVDRWPIVFVKLIKSFEDFSCRASSHLYFVITHLLGWRAIDCKYSCTDSCVDQKCYSTPIAKSREVRWSIDRQLYLKPIHFANTACFVQVNNLLPKSFEKKLRGN